MKSTVIKLMMSFVQITTAIPHDPMMKMFIKQVQNILIIIKKLLINIIVNNAYGKY